MGAGERTGLSHLQKIPTVLNVLQSQPIIYRALDAAIRNSACMYVSELQACSPIFLSLRGPPCHFPECSGTLASYAELLCYSRLEAPVDLLFLKLQIFIQI